jgi:phosphopantothenoylcysteine decarboxylase/phosphopantothenate--cysteine ligase
MGVALARAALVQGAEVVVVSGPAREAFPPGVRVIKVTTALEMRDALEKEFNKADACIMAAAVSDFKPVVVHKEKIQRRGNGSITVRLEPNPDIAALLGRKKGKRVLVGFALETSADEASALRKMKEKRCDLMILNQADTSIGRDDTLITIVSDEGASDQLPVMKKSEAATLIVQRISARLG